jgi:hypothetical protein
MRCQSYAEKELFRKQGQVTGIIFNLKNNYKWKEEQTINISELDEKKKELKDFFDEHDSTND